MFPQKGSAVIISASRRTDIPAFYADWFMNRIRAGYCEVVNPYNRSQRSRIPLEAAAVDAIVFWTRHPRPLLRHLDELDRCGYRYYFLYTLLDYPATLDPGLPPIETRVETFRALADRIGPARVIWRYDPIVFTAATDAAFHREAFDRLAGRLAGATRRCIISLLDIYRKTQRRLDELEATPFRVHEPTPGMLADSLPAMARAAKQHGMAIASCASRIDLSSCGIGPGRCIDDAWLRLAFSLEVPSQKDPRQRPACRCVASRDIGAYDTCLFGCQYCYATTSVERARANHARHDPSLPWLLPPGDPQTP